MSTIKQKNNKINLTGNKNILESRVDFSLKMFLTNEIKEIDGSTIVVFDHNGNKYSGKVTSQITEGRIDEIFETTISGYLI